MASHAIVHGVAADSKGPRKPATYEDLLRVPEHLVAEIIDGELYTSPRPAPPHALAGLRLGIRLGPLQDDNAGADGWWMFPEPELHFQVETPKRQVLVPDFAGWRRTRMPKYPKAAYFTLAPDWVCEILSPSTARIDRTKKLGIYAREGVPYAWLIDPVMRTLDVTIRTGSHWTTLATYEGHDRVRAAPFADIEIDLAYLWGETPNAPAK